VLTSWYRSDEGTWERYLTIDARRVD
jgi:hypothetical protein